MKTTASEKPSAEDSFCAKNLVFGGTIRQDCSVRSFSRSRPRRNHYCPNKWRGQQYSIPILLAPFYLIACATDSHSPERGPRSIGDGITQDEVKFDKKDYVEVGSKVDTFNSNCKTTRFKDTERTTCQEEPVGVGRVVEIVKDISTVEFASSSIIVPKTEFEVQKSEVK